MAQRRRRQETSHPSPRRAADGGSIIPPCIRRSWGPCPVGRCQRGRQRAAPPGRIRRGRARSGRSWWTSRCSTRPAGPWPSRHPQPRGPSRRAPPARVVDSAVPASNRLTLLAIDESSFPAVARRTCDGAARVVAALDPTRASRCSRSRWRRRRSRSPPIARRCGGDRAGGRPGQCGSRGAEAPEGRAPPPVDQQSADRGDGREVPDDPAQAPRDQAAYACGRTGAVAARPVEPSHHAGAEDGPPVLGGDNVKSDVPEVTDALRPLVNAALASRSAVDIVQLPAVGGTTRAAWLDDLASVTGGIVVDGRRDAEAAGRVFVQADGVLRGRTGGGRS